MTDPVQDAEAATSKQVGSPDTATVARTGSAHLPTGAKFAPTAEQQAIITAACERMESLMIRAYAGCSKTTTLELLSRALPSALPILYIVFNTKNRKEAESRFPPNVVVKTINGLGHGAWGRALGKKLVLDDRKLGKLVTSVCKEAHFDATTEQWSCIREVVTKAQQAGLVPSDFAVRSLVPDDAGTWKELAESCGYYDCDAILLQFARQALIASIRLAYDGTISFDDQIYMSVMFNGAFPRFPLVLVDEAQDQSVLNIAMIKRCAADRLVVVGDEKQACYVWRGAAGDAMERLRALRTQWIDLPLATTFRCTRLVVSRNTHHAPGFKAYEKNHEGKYYRDGPRARRTEDGDARPEWNWSDVELVAPNPSATSAVLCRNNAPLLSLAFKLLASGTPVVMLGRDIGKGLVTLAKKLLIDDETSREVCVFVIEAWREKEVTLALANGADRKAEGINDRADCLVAVLGSDGCESAGALRAKLTALFARESGKVTLSSIHRAKGLEYDVVLHLDPWRIPSKYARKAGGVELAQEWNLKYIAETRTKHTLIEANLEDFSQ